MERWAAAWSRRLAVAAGLPSDEEEVIAYALVWVGNTFLSFAGVAAFGYLLGAMPEALTASVCAALLRSLSGGAHYSSPGRCALMTTLTYGFFGWLADALVPLLPSVPQTIMILGAALAVVGLPLAWRMAPDPDPKRPLSPAERRRFHILSLFAIALIAAFGSGIVIDTSLTLRLAAIFGAAWQLLTITPVGHQLLGWFDRCLVRLGGQTG